MNKLMISAAVIALAGTAAHAQEAFITQLGDGHQGLNYSDFASGTTQVISQQAPRRPARSNRPSEVALGYRPGGSFEAANLSSGRGNAAGNQAYAYQWDTRADNTFNGDLGAVEMSSLNYQLGINNTAISAQLETRGAGGTPTYMSQIIQEGDNNVGINWATDAGSQLGSLATFDAPSITIRERATNAPLPNVREVFPYGTRAVVR